YVVTCQFLSYTVFLHQLVSLRGILLKLDSRRIGGVIGLYLGACFSESLKLLLSITPKVVPVHFCCGSRRLKHLLQCIVEVHCVVLLRLALLFFESSW